MQELLKLKLKDFLQQNRPDLLISLQQEGQTGIYLDDKTESLDGLPEKLLAEGRPPYVITELCMAALTADLGESRFQYLAELLDTDFLPMADSLRVNGLLTYELINLMEECNPVFEEMGFNAEDRMLRYAIAGTIQEYAERNWNSQNLALWLSLSGKN
ncbi:MAG TPA: hypothetical protein VHA56_07885 [Mucilaginibacter sp.]|nr:hypothetical protein [Mucilaginibacter sp.]